MSLLNQDDLAKGASSQGAGSTLGSLFGYYFFIPLSSVSFCNKYIFSTEHTVIPSFARIIQQHSLGTTADFPKLFNDFCRMRSGTCIDNLAICERTLS